MLHHAFHARLAFHRQLKSGRNAARFDGERWSHSSRSSRCRRKYQELKAYETGDMQPVIQTLPRGKTPQSHEDNIENGEVIQPAMQGLGAEYKEADEYEDVEGLVLIDTYDGYHDELEDIPPVPHGDSTDEGIPPVAVYSLFVSLKISCLIQEF